MQIYLQPGIFSRYGYDAICDGPLILLFSTWRQFSLFNAANEEDSNHHKNQTYYFSSGETEREFWGLGEHSFFRIQIGGGVKSKVDKF